MATAVRPVTVDLVLSLARALQAAHESNAVSHKHHALAELLLALRNLPPDARYQPIAPADAVERELNADGLRYVVKIDDNFLGFRLWDVTGDNAMGHFDLPSAKQLVGDLLAVIAAMEASRG